MQKAFERVLGGEYEVVIEEELKELKQSDKLLVGEPCAILHRTDINLGRPASECETEDKSCYIVFLPSKYSIVCNKDFGSFKSKDGSIKLISLNYFIENLLGFNFTFLQLIEPKALVWASDDFKNLVKKYRNIVDTQKHLIRIKYSTLVYTATSIYNDIKSGKIKDDKSCKNRLFLLYIVCKACRQLAALGEIGLTNIADKTEYSEVKQQFNNNRDMSILKKFIEAAKVDKLYIETKVKSCDKEDKILYKYDIMQKTITNILNMEV